MSRSNLLETVKDCLQIPFFHSYAGVSDREDKIAIALSYIQLDTALIGKFDRIA